MPLSSSARHYIAWYAAGIAVACLISLPLMWPGHFSRPLYENQNAQLAAKIGLILVTLTMTWFALQGAPLSRPMRTVTWILCLGIACMCENVHYWNVDKGHYFPPSMFADNTAWQRHMHHGIIRLEYGMSPHSYRFLSHSVVAVFHAITGHFEFGRIIYRIMFHALFFAVVFRYARLYVSTPAAVATLVVLAALYPQTLFAYAGQFVDPASYLSFAVCLFCVARKYDALFGPALFLGVFAKESVIVMALCRAFAGSDRPKAILAATGYFAIALALVVAIRVKITGGFGYGTMSGVDLSHIWVNISQWYRWWGPFYLCTLGLLLPGAFLGARSMDRSFQWTCAVVTASLVVSSTMFSWLTEVRNIGPALIPLAVANLRYAETRVRLAGI